MGAIGIGGGIRVFGAHSTKGNGHNGLSQVHCMQTGLGKPKKTAKRIVWIRRLLCVRDIRNQRIGTEYGNEVHFGYGPQDKLNIIWKPSIHYCHNYIKNTTSQLRKTRNGTNIGQRFGIIPSPRSIPMENQVMNGKMSQRVHIIRSLGLFSCHGFRHIKTLCWKKMETWVMDQENQALCTLGRRKKGLNLITIVTILLILPLYIYRIAGSL